MSAIVPRAVGWRLERDAGVTAVVARPGIAVHAARPARGPVSVSGHTCPAWKLVVALEGHLCLGGPAAHRRDSSLLLPPGAMPALVATGGFVAVLVDSWWTGPRDVDPRPVARLGVELLGDGARASAPASVLDPLARHLAVETPVGAVGRALERLRDTDELGDLATDLGVTPAWARARVQAVAGTTPTRVRQWMRLVRALSAPPASVDLAEAAHEAGFADQAHLTRLAVRLAGRMPGSLRSGA